MLPYKMLLICLSKYFQNIKFLLYIIKYINSQSCVLACVQWLTATCILEQSE